MGFLRFLERMRCAPLDFIMTAVTYIGYELCFMALAMVMFWCVDKRRAYYLFTVCFFGLWAGQFLKMLFRIPRPWIMDPDLTIVESARSTALGYSFPSGHTQNAAGTFGTIYAYSGKKRIRVSCAVLTLLVSFSRMYLGVHTPLDVVAGLIISLGLAAAFFSVFKTRDRCIRSFPVILAVLAVCIAGYVAFLRLYNFPADTDSAEMANAIKNTDTMIGCIAGLALSFFADRKRDFSTQAPLAGQILKCLLGLGILFLLKTFLKAPLAVLLPSEDLANIIRYFIMVVFAGCIWPLTFPFFAGIGNKEN